MSPPDFNGRLKLAKRILRDYPSDWYPLAEKSKGDTGAQFQERCRNLALQHYWKEHSDEDPA